MATLASVQATYEKRWLSYARDVLKQESGCPCDADEIAWPGFIGANYAAGRVLIVGSIHNAPVLRSSGIYDIVPEVKTFLKNMPNVLADKQYLDAVRNAYMGAIPRWQRYVNENGLTVSGTVWTNIAKIVKALELAFADVAFTNLAKCGLPTKTSWPRERSRIEAHERATPLNRLIRDIEPHYVLLAKEQRDLEKIVVLETTSSTILRRCHNLNFTSNGERRDDWLPRDVSAYRALQAS
jgi:hypothetical protein